MTNWEPYKIISNTGKYGKQLKVYYGANEKQR